MMRHSEILVECHSGLILRLIEGLMCLGDEWTLMLRYCLSLSLKLLHEE